MNLKNPLNPREVRTSCRRFRGDRPCLPHKQEGVHCSACSFFQPLGPRLLIIKLGAAGDVIRTTPLLQRLQEEKPSAFVTWVTHFPELVPSRVDERVPLNFQTATWLLSREYETVFSLDKDPEAIALGERVTAQEKFGFGMDDYGRCRPFNDLAQHKWLTGLFDDLNRANTKSYPQEILEMCGYDFRGERYLLDWEPGEPWNLPLPQPRVGLNTGCGSRWPSRLWPEEHWLELIRRLRGRGWGVLLLGGPDEDDRNRRLAGMTGATYLGTFPLTRFISLVAECDVVVTQVTMALHIAIGLGKRVVLMNNIFNRYEFELYGLGEIVEPPEPCGCFFSPVCPHDSMRSILPDVVFTSVRQQVAQIER